MPFARQPTDAERIAKSANRGIDPPDGSASVVQLRREMYQLALASSRRLVQMRACHDRCGETTLRSALGDTDYDDFVNDYNAIRTMVLAVAPDLTADVPDAL